MRENVKIKGGFLAFLVQNKSKTLYINRAVKHLLVSVFHLDLRHQIRINKF